MDTKFVIVQLVNALIIIITTVVVTRVTLKGNLGISQTYKEKFKIKAIMYGLILILLGILGITDMASGGLGAVRSSPNPPRRYVYCKLVFAAKSLHGWFGSTYNTLVSVP